MSDKVDLKILEEHIGDKYSENTMGCLSPVYLLHPRLPKYEFINEKDYFLPIVENHCIEKSLKDIKDGDLLMIKVKDDYHFAIFKSPNLIFHCTENSKLRKSKIDLYKRYIIKVYEIQNSS